MVTLDPVNYIESTIERWKQHVGEVTLQSCLPPWEANLFIYLSIYLPSQKKLNLYAIVSCKLYLVKFVSLIFANPTTKVKVLFLLEESYRCLLLPQIRYNVHCEAKRIHKL